MVKNWKLGGDAKPTVKHRRVKKNLVRKPFNIKIIGVQSSFGWLLLNQQIVASASSKLCYPDFILIHPSAKFISQVISFLIFNLLFMFSFLGDIIFNARYPELPPDFIFGEDAEFLPEPSELPVSTYKTV